MAEELIVQNIIRRLGQSQPERSVPELLDRFVDVDERDPATLAAFATRLAPLIRYYRAEKAEIMSAGDWTPFFAKADVERLVAAPSADVTPHLALFGAFLRLYEESRGVVNRLTGEHLKFFYERVLSFKNRSAEPDRAHVLIEAKNNTPPVRVGPDHLLTAGKGPQGERLYAPVRESIVRNAKVASLRSIHVDAQLGVRSAPIANSADGMGSDWETADRNWPPFGSAQLPAAKLGFGIASPVLRMAEGRRDVACALQLERVDVVTLASSESVFEAYVTGAKGWLGPYAAAAAVEGGSLVLKFAVEANQPAVVDYDAELHGLAFSAEGPVVQFLLRTTEAGSAYAALKDAVVRRARVRVDVTGARALSLESDAGPLNPKRAFLPFGPAPTLGSRFYVSYPEALSKSLTKLNLRLRWMGAPDNFAYHYNNYDSQSHPADQFKAKVSFRDAGNLAKQDESVYLFGAPNAAGWVEFGFTREGTFSAKPPSKSRQILSLLREPDNWARKSQKHFFGLSHLIGRFSQPFFERDFVERFLDIPSIDPREGAITFALTRDFLHATYRNRVTEIAVKGIKDVSLKEPYTPTVQAIELDYAASSDEVDVSSADITESANPDVQFFHVDAFGQRRDHGHRRSSLSFVSVKEVPLVPEHRSEGELLIGLAGVAARDSVNLLLQVAEATANPDLPRARVSWSALCDNEWKPLLPEELVADGSDELRRSGVVSLIVPKDATTAHTILPAGLIWLRADVVRDSGAACRLVAVEANAIEVKLVQPDAGTAHLATALPPGSIAKLKTPIAGVKGVKQPYASFGGRPAESSSAMYVRASERLRHRNRCITPWDYERMVLERFPSVHQVKCVPHAREGAWLSPGHVMLVVVADLRDRVAPAAGDEPPDPSAPVALNLLEPRVDKHTLADIEDYVKAHAGPQVQLTVKNPRYQKIQVSMDVKFSAGRDVEYHKRLLSNALTRFLSPWAFDGSRIPVFGGRVFRSVLLDFVEELEYVDYLTSFAMFVDRRGDLPEARPDRPDAILVSSDAHDIEEA